MNFCTYVLNICATYQSSDDSLFGSFNDWVDVVTWALYRIGAFPVAKSSNGCCNSVESVVERWPVECTRGRFGMDISKLSSG